MSDNINIDEEDIDDDSLLKSFTEAKRTLVSVIEEKKRSQLPDSSFGIPEDRKYPLDTKKHVESAIRLFSHSEKSKKKELAKRIKAKADEYNIEIPETTQCYKYLQESAKNIFEPTCDEHKLFRKYMLYKKQLDSGKISKAEYDKKLKNDKIPINLFDRELEKYKKAETRPEGKGKVGKRTVCDDGIVSIVVDKLEAEKVMRWYKICKTTDDYKEYKTYFNNLCKFFKIPNTYILAKVHLAPYKNDKQVILTFKKDSRDIDTSNKKLYHTSNVNNVTRLNGSFRSKDGKFLFPEKRIYFGIDTAVKRSVSDSDESAKYTYKPKSKINKLSHANDYSDSDEAGFIRAEHLDVDKVKTEACKDVQTTRKFVSDVEKLAKKYNANYFIVTDGASGIHNQGEPAVKFHRDKQIEWEKKNGFDPDDDWRNNPDDMTGYKLK